MQRGYYGTSCRMTFRKHFPKHVIPEPEPGASALASVKGSPWPTPLLAPSLVSVLAYDGRSWNQNHRLQIHVIWFHVSFTWWHNKLNVAPPDHRRMLLDVHLQPFNCHLCTISWFWYCHIIGDMLYRACPWLLFHVCSRCPLNERRVICFVSWTWAVTVANELARLRRSRWHVHNASTSGASCDPQYYLGVLGAAAYRRLDSMM